MTFPEILQEKQTPKARLSQGGPTEAALCAEHEKAFLLGDHVGRETLVLVNSGG